LWGKKRPALTFGSKSIFSTHFFPGLRSDAESEEELKRIFNQERKFQTKYFGDVEVVVKGTTRALSFGFQLIQLMERLSFSECPCPKQSQK
jgi:hypothetical protein